MIRVLMQVFVLIVIIEVLNNFVDKLKILYFSIFQGL